MAQKQVKILINAKDNASQKIQEIAGGFEQAFGNAAKRIGQVGAVLGGFGAVGAAASLKLAAGFEQTRVSFETMLGDAAEATKLLEELTEFSTRTPFEPDEIFATSKQLLAFGFRAKEITTILQVIGDVSAGTGKDIQELGRIMGKVFTKGKAQGEELNQMAEAGIPIIKELQKLYGVTGQEVFELGSKGKISFEDINTALTSMSQEAGIFFKMMDKQSQTLNGQFSTLKGNVKELGRNFGEILLPAMKDVVSEMNEMAKGILETQGGPGFLTNFLAAFEDVYLGGVGPGNESLQAFLEDRGDKKPISKQDLADARAKRAAGIAKELAEARARAQAEAAAEAKRLAKEAENKNKAEKKKAAVDVIQTTKGTAFDPDRGGALQAFVMRGLSGLSTANQPMKKTEKNTAETVNQLQTTNNTLGIIAERMKGRYAPETVTV